MWLVDLCAANDSLKYWYRLLQVIVGPSRWDGTHDAEWIYCGERKVLAISRTNGAGPESPLSLFPCNTRQNQDKYKPDSRIWEIKKTKKAFYSFHGPF